MFAGYVFGALQPATGEAFTLTYERRTTVNWVDFLSAVEAWIAPAVERVYAVLDNLNIHSAPDVLLFGLLHPRWELVFQPKYAAYLVRSSAPHADRTLVEDPALAGAEGPAKAGPRSRTPSHELLPTGMITGIRSSGDAGDVIGNAAASASPPSRISQ